MPCVVCRVVGSLPWIMDHEPLDAGIVHLASPLANVSIVPIIYEPLLRCGFIRYPCQTGGRAQYRHATFPGG